MAIGKFLMALVIGIVITNNISAQIKVGDKKDGGIVYWIDASGIHGLIADVKDLGKFNWDAAVAACKKKGEGWRLPNKDELDKLYKNKQKLGGFTNGNYWGSADYEGITFPSPQNFGNGIQGKGDKNGVYSVRAVRSF